MHPSIHLFINQLSQLLWKWTIVSLRLKILHIPCDSRKVLRLLWRDLEKNDIFTSTFFTHLNEKLIKRLNALKVNHVKIKYHTQKRHALVRWVWMQFASNNCSQESVSKPKVTMLYYKLHSKATSGTTRQQYTWKILEEPACVIVLLDRDSTVLDQREILLWWGRGQETESPPAQVLVSVADSHPSRLTSPKVKSSISNDIMFSKWVAEANKSHSFLTPSSAHHCESWIKFTHFFHVVTELPAGHQRNCHWLQWEKQYIYKTRQENEKKRS